MTQTIVRVLTLILIIAVLPLLPWPDIPNVVWYTLSEVILWLRSLNQWFAIDTFLQFAIYIFMIEISMVIWNVWGQIAGHISGEDTFSSKDL